MNSKEGIGDIIRRLREERGFTYYKLGKLTGIDRGYIARIEAGEAVNITYETANKLAIGLGVDPAVFRGHTEPPTKPKLRATLDNEINQLQLRLKDLQKHLEVTEVVELPVYGSIPAHQLTLTANLHHEIIEIPKVILGEGIDLREAFVVRLIDETSTVEGCASGDLVVVAPMATYIPNKLYLVSEKGIVTGKRLTALASENNKGVTILGRILLSGQWKQH